MANFKRRAERRRCNGHPKNKALMAIDRLGRSMPLEQSVFMRWNNKEYSCSRRRFETDKSSLAPGGTSWFH